MPIFRWVCRVFGTSHRWVHEAGESYIKCNCGATVDFEEIPANEPVA